MVNLKMLYNIESWVYKVPGSHISVLFLGPEDLYIRVLGKFFLDSVIRERTELFYSHKCDILKVKKIFLLP